MMRRALSAILVPAAVVVSMLFVSLGREAAAQAPASLAEAAREAAKDFHVVTPDELAKSKASLATAAENLDRFLRRNASAQVTKSWKEHLHWEGLIAMAKDRPAPAELLASILAEFSGKSRDLKLQPFIQLHSALEEYAAAIQLPADEKLKAEFTKRVEEMAKQLETYAKDPAAGDAALAIGDTLGWLTSHRQAPQLVAKVRQTYGQPNFFGYASQKLAAAGIEDTIDRVTGVSDNILGTDVHGSARMTGKTTLIFNDNPSAADMSILLNGSIFSNTVGYHGPVTIYTTGLTTASGQKQIVMTPEGLLGYYARASCATNTNINNIQARHGFIEKMAWKRAGKQKSQAEQIASQHAASRVAGQMNSEAGKMIAEQNGRYLEKFRDPLLRRGEFPEEFAFSSKSDRAELRVRQDSPALLSAPGGPPEAAGGHDLGFRAHESVVTNFGQGLLGGYELTDLRLEKLIKDDLKGDLPDELKVTLPDGTLDSEKEPWSIIFAKDLPTRAKFNGGKLWIAIRADGFTRGEGDKPGKYKPALTELIEISASYNIEKTDKGATLRRDGDVQVRFPNRADPIQITLRDSPIVTFIRRKFRSLFKEEFIGEGIALKGRWERAGKLQLQDIKSDAAWLTLGWKLPTAAETQKVAANEE